MKPKFVLPALALICAVALSVALLTSASDKPINGDNMDSIYKFTLKDIDGKDTTLSQYKGKVVLLVNVASKCGLTPQYEGLQRLYDKYKDKGFVILGLPANNFGGQEPGTNEEIKSFCSLKYNVTFPIFSKISVKGEDMHPLYKYLTEKETNPEYSGEIKWNFNKFLVDKNGKIVGRFEPRVTPESEPVTAAIEKAIGQRAK